ncbi:hypothetical protein VTO42DRAFT_5649 [Malbranchea cinnamomea]
MCAPFLARFVESWRSLSHSRTHTKRGEAPHTGLSYNHPPHLRRSDHSTKMRAKWRKKRVRRLKRKRRKVRARSK